MRSGGRSIYDECDCLRSESVLRVAPAVSLAGIREEGKYKVRDW